MPASKQIGPKVPSSSSRDYGEPFAAIFARYNHDFYAVDPHLFSPAEVVFQNLETGRSHAFGGINPERSGAIVLVVNTMMHLDISLETESDRLLGSDARADDHPRRPGLWIRLARRRPVSARPNGSIVRFQAVPFPEVFARVGVGAAERRGRRCRADRGRRRAGADDAAGQPGAGGLPDGRPASRGRRGRSGLEPAAGRRGGRRQVPDAGPARPGRPAGSTDLDRPVGRRRPWRPSRRWGATSWSSRSSARRDAGSCASATASSPGEASTRSSGWGRCSTSSG